MKTQNLDALREAAESALADRRLQNTAGFATRENTQAVLELIKDSERLDWILSMLVDQNQATDTWWIRIVVAVATGKSGRKALDETREALMCGKPVKP